MGRALTDGKASFEEIREDYYASAFGPFKDFAAKAHGEIERTVSFAYMKEEISASEALPLFKEGTAFLTVLLKKFPSTEGAAPVFVESMEILRFMAENVLNLVEVLVLKIEGRSEEEIAEADKRRKVFFNERELRFQPYADGFYVNMITDGIVACEKTGIYASAQDDKKRYERGAKEV